MPHIFPLNLLLATFAGWVYRHQAEVIDYNVEENRVLKEQLGKRRLRLTDNQRRRLAARGRILGRRVLVRIASRLTGWSNWRTAVAYCSQAVERP